MSIKSNSKAALDKIRAYIMKNHDFDGYENAPAADDLPSVCKFILDTCEAEKQYQHYTTKQDQFLDWCQGLPSVLDTMYYYNVPAVDLVGDILEQTEQERSRYDEQTAADFMSYLLFREITKQAAKAQ